MGDFIIFGYTPTEDELRDFPFTGDEQAPLRTKSRTYIIAIWGACFGGHHLFLGHHWRWLAQNALFMGLPLSLKPFESFTLAGLVLAAIIGCHFLAIRTVALSSPHDPQYSGRAGKFFMTLLPTYQISLLWGLDWWQGKNKQRFGLTGPTRAEKRGRRQAR